VSDGFAAIGGYIPISMSDQFAVALLDDLEARGLKLRGRARSDYESVDSLLEILRSRGLAIGNEALARHYLDTIGYHRISAFFPSFYEDEKRFDGEIPTSIEDIFHLYSFDRRLRLLIMGPLEKVEVALRALIIREMGDYLKRRGLPPTIDLSDKRFYNLAGEKKGKDKLTQNEVSYQIAMQNCREGARQHWMARFPSAQKKNYQITKEIWAGLFPQYYKDIPAWELLQTASFGPLIHIYSILTNELSVSIAKHFKLHNKRLKTIFFALKELRNACAHHEAVWNWDSLNKSVEFPFPNRYRILAGIIEENQNLLYPYCALIHILLSVLSYGKSTWHRRLKKLVNEFSTLYGTTMGFPKEWQTMPFWCVSDVELTSDYERLHARIHAKASS
jgi:abortive infection bacteriophage resistance protein